VGIKKKMGLKTC